MKKGRYIGLFPLLKTVDSILQELHIIKYKAVRKEIPSHTFNLFSDRPVIKMVMVFRCSWHRNAIVALINVALK